MLKKPRNHSKKPISQAKRVVTIDAPDELSSDLAERLGRMPNVKLVWHDTEECPFIRPGNGTLVHVIDGAGLFESVRDGHLQKTLQRLDAMTETPVLIIKGFVFDKMPWQAPETRAVTGLLTHLALFTNMRVIHAPNSFVAAGMLQIIAKQEQFGSTSLGIEYERETEDEQTTDAEA